MKKTFFVVLLIFTLFTCLGVVSFADEGYDSYVINPGDYTLAIDEFDQPMYLCEVSADFSFSFNGVDYNCFSNYSFSYSFFTADNDEFVIWSQGEWFSDSREIVITVSEPQYLSLSEDYASSLNSVFPGLLEPCSGSDNVQPEVPDLPDDPTDTTGPEDPGETDIDPNGIYFEVYDIFVSYVYGDVELTSDMILTATLFSTILCVVVLCLPFLVCILICKFIFAWRF